MAIFKVKKCPACHGFGKCADGSVCESCEGVGEIPADATVDVIPCR